LLAGRDLLLRSLPVVVRALGQLGDRAVEVACTLIGVEIIARPRQRIGDGARILALRVDDPLEDLGARRIHRGFDRGQRQIVENVLVDRLAAADHECRARCEALGCLFLSDRGAGGEPEREQIGDKVGRRAFLVKRYLEGLIFRIDRLDAGQDDLIAMPAPLRRWQRSAFLDLTLARADVVADICLLDRLRHGSDRGAAREQEKRSHQCDGREANR
jgi:hypothetical protein